MSFQPFDTAELTSMRDEVEATFNLTATLVRLSAPISDGKGGTADTSDSSTTFQCLLQPLAVQGQPSEDATDGQQVGSTTHWRVLAPYGTGLGPNDRLTIGGLNYEVIEVNQARSIPLCEDVHAVRLR